MRRSSMQSRPPAPSSSAPNASVPPTRSLADLRNACGLSQQQVALALGTSQPEVSRLERRGDLHLSTLRRYVEALGGELRVMAEFAGQSVLLDSKTGSYNERSDAA